MTLAAAWRVTESKKNRSGEAFCALKFFFHRKPLSSKLFKSISPSLSLSPTPVLEFRLMTFEEELRGEDNKEEHLPVSAAVIERL